MGAEIFVVLGPPAAGKSTWIKSKSVLYKEKSVSVQRFDDMFGDVGSKTWYDYSGYAHDWRSEPLHLWEFHAYRSMFWGGSLWWPSFDVLFVEPPQPMIAEEARLLQYIASEKGAQVTVVWCNASIEERILRNRVREDCIPEDVVERLMPTHEIINALCPSRTEWVTSQLVYTAA